MSCVSLLTRLHGETGQKPDLTDDHDQLGLQIRLGSGGQPFCKYVENMAICSVIKENALNTERFSPDTRNKLKLI